MARVEFQFIITSKAVTITVYQLDRMDRNNGAVSLQGLWRSEGSFPIQSANLFNRKYLVSRESARTPSRLQVTR